MGEQDLLDFVSAYPKAELRAQLVVSDRNAPFRRRVAAQVADNPGSAPTELLRDLVENEPVCGRSADCDFKLVAQLLSHLLNAEGVNELSTLLGTVGHNMDLDGFLQTGGLTLDRSTRNALQKALQKIDTSHPRVLVASKAVANAVTQSGAG